MEKQSVELRWEVGPRDEGTYPSDQNFVTFEVNLAGRPLPSDCYEQLGLVVQQIECLVEMLAPSAEVIDDTPGMAELKAEAAEAVRRLVEQGDVRLRPALENVSERFPIGSLVRHRGFYERQGRVVGHNVFTGVVKVEMVSSPEGAPPLDGWYEGGDLELAPKAPARKPLKVGHLVRSRTLPERTGRVTEVNPAGTMVRIVGGGDVELLDGWYEVEVLERVPERDLF